MKRVLSVCPLIVMVLVVGTTALAAQGVTTASISATVTSESGTPIPGARVLAVHGPSGTTYSAGSRADGRASVPGMRVGGPYSVTATAIGFQSQTRENIYLTLGVATNVAFALREVAVELAGLTVTAERDAIFSSNRTGAATSVGREALALPTISGRIEDFARLTPQYSGSGFGFSFAGQDNRLNNITVDGSYFNNSFGLAGQPGDRTGVAPISLDAIEQVQVNIAPYDVRQGNFVGAGVNTVTRSGTNEFSGSAYYQFRNESMVGSDAGASPFDPGLFKFHKTGVNLGGPIIRNKLFFFGSYESDGLASPGTTFRANTGGETVGGNITRVLATDLDQLSTYLSTNFGYDAGPYQGYEHETPATRFLARLDFNISERNKLSLRYNLLNSNTDVLLSNSSSLGFGTRRSNTTGLNYQNSNYLILENIRSVVGEWNSIVGSNKSNNLIIGYTHHDESRDSRGTFFPMVDILEGGSVYTTFGFEPFTPNNELRYSSFQLQNNFTIYGAKHDLTFGVSAERYESENVFFPGSQSAYVYNSLADFYTDANDYLANPNRTVSPITLRTFQLRWSNIPGQVKPIQPLEVFYTGAYAQDDWQATSNLKVVAGVRLDLPFFGNTGFANAQVDTLSFRDESGNTVRYSTSQLPGKNLLISPRIGFNWDVRGDRSTQVRGGSGIFTGRPAYVWVSNQIGENGVLTGFEQLTNTTARPFHPDPDHYKPASVTGNPASSYGLAFTDPNFKFPQLWRSNLAVDHKLPFGLAGTLELLYNRDVNGISYINANLSAPSAFFTGADARPRWTAGNRVNGIITSAIVLKNESEGDSYNVAASLERQFRGGLFAKAAYSYGRSRSTVDAGSIAFGSWNNNQHAGDPNNPGLGFAATNPGHRVFAALSYRREYFRFGATTVSLFWEGRTDGNASYTYSGDLNGDGGTSNDLLYIPRDASEMHFQQYNVGADTFTVAEQVAAWDAYIEQDDYLRPNRGKYTSRGGVWLPMVFRADFSIAQEVFTDVGGKRNKLSVRLDILNFGNLLNKNWGQGNRLVNAQPLIVPTAAQGGPADAQGRTQYRLRAIGGQLMTKTFEKTAFLNDVYRLQLSLRYDFN
ncbi:MAG TPA: carboxypeptidase regulatory-like domain-containing protein [Gemmatimonadales bacterium]